jgi:hypothetical protein
MSIPTNDFDNARHEDWLKFSRRWEMAIDFWRGGLHVLQPDHICTDALFVVERNTDDGQGGLRPQGAPGATVYEWRTRPARSYIFKHSRETQHEWEDRCRRAINLPLFQYVINTLSAGTLREAPVRDGGGPEWRAIHEDMDLVGTDVDAFFRRALSLGLVFGRIHAVSDMARPERPAVSLAEQMERGERPYTYLVTPLELVDWRTDEHGSLEWGVIIERAPDDRIPGKPIPLGTEPAHQYRVWYRDGWELYRKRPRGKYFDVVDGGQHGLGRVPIDTLYCSRLAQANDMSCETPLPDLLDLNRHLFNDLSELDDTDRSQAFAMLGIPVADGMSAGPMDIGPRRGLAYPAEAGSPSYISADPLIAAGRWSRLQEKGFLGRQLGGVSRGKAEYSKEERSAAAISAEAEDKKNQLAWWAKALQEFDQGLHGTMAAWMGAADYPRAAYSADFETKGTMTSVQEIVQLSAVAVIGEARETVAILAEPLIRKLLTGQGVPEDKIRAALDALEESGKKEPKPPPAPPVPFGQPKLEIEPDDEDEGDPDAA